MTQSALMLLMAFGLDLLIGDPPYPFHPVRLMGRLIQRLEKTLREKCPTLELASIALPLLTLLIPVAIYLILHAAFKHWAWMLDLFLAYSLLAMGDLLRHAQKVEFALKHRTLADAREAVQMLVGRSTTGLDGHAVARAAIESVAENFVDGFLSPIFWLGLGTLVFNSPSGGILLLLCFKVISTLDSMVGYRNNEYQALGRVSAKLDDALNFIPARLAIPLITLAARLTGNNWQAAWHIGRRDRLRHASPNSAHAEATMAGALNLRLGGPAVYSHGTVEKPWMGDGNSEASPDDIGQAMRIVGWSGALAAGAVILLLLQFG